MIDDERLSPFDLGRGEEGVLLVHGYTGTPYEMRYLGERLAARGFRVRGVRLAGHGLDPYALENAAPEAWLSDARAGLEALAGCRRVCVAGFSMGALVAICLAAERPERVAALALLAPALRFTGFVRVFLAAFRSARMRRWIRFIPKGGSAVLDRAERRRNPSVAKVPTTGALHLADMVARAEAAMPKVKAPALVVYSLFDPTVSSRAAKLVAQKLGSRPVRLVAVRDSLHVITIDRDRDRVADEVASFFSEGAGAPSAVHSQGGRTQGVELP